MFEEEAGYKLLDIGWMKVNVNVACLEEGGSSSCGGVVRDERGFVFGGFMHNIGRGSSFHVKDMSYARRYEVCLGIEMP